MLVVVDILLSLLALPVLVWTGYLAVLAIFSRDVSVAMAPSPRVRFDVIVPAHDEEGGIGATVASLRAVDYPEPLRRIVVVADNCSDATAGRASEAGATVLVRQDSSRRGKGYALAHAFERTLAEGQAEAVVVVDADSKVSANLLRAFDTRLQRGALAVQAEYCVANPEASWRTRLMHIGFTLFHDVRSRSRELLGLSCGLRGNGMAFATSLLREVPHDAFSVVEDVEYGLRLGMAGIRVHYAGEAKVFGEMVSSEKASRTQRQRWEGGRVALARMHVAPLLLAAVRRQSPVLLDLALDLLVPPLTYVAAAASFGFVAVLVWVTLGHRSGWLLVPWAFSVAGLAVYIGRGIVLSRVGPRAILDLGWAPVYMAWKVALALRGSRSRSAEWVRTAREGEKR